MILREKYIESETDRLERTTREAIDRIMLNPGVASPEYEAKYNAIMDNYRLRWNDIQSLKKTTYD